MGVFLDVETGKWFDTLSELKEFQKLKGLVKQDPSSLLKKKKVEEVKIEEKVVPAVTEVPAQEPEPTDEIYEEEVVLNPEDPTSFVVKLSREDMVERLRDAGFDGRSIGSKKSDDDIAEMYLKHFGSF